MLRYIAFARSGSAGGRERTSARTRCCLYAFPLRGHQLCNLLIDFWLGRRVSCKWSADSGRDGYASVHPDSSDDTSKPSYGYQPLERKRSEALKAKFPGLTSLPLGRDFQIMKVGAFSFHLLQACHEDTLSPRMGA